MDVPKILAELNAERDAINAAIASLERLARTRRSRGFPTAAGLLVSPQVGALLARGRGPQVDKVRQRGRVSAKKPT
jgi:hypothetical protein